ncbi:MAG: formylglycine-generating enzyme family protein [Steroidobacteraceae bacterium]
MNIGKVISGIAWSAIFSWGFAPSALAQFKAVQISVPASTPGSTFRSCEDCPSMVVIPSGSFKMGSDRMEGNRTSLPIRDITIAKPFALAQTEVTEAQFAQFMKETKVFPPEASCISADPKVGFSRFYASWGWNNIEDASGNRPDFPVRCVSWYMAKGYVDWLANKTGLPYRLPSEAEWEYAAKAGKSTDWWWGDNLDPICEYENGLDLSAQKAGISAASGTVMPCDDGFGGLAPAGSKKPNPFGLYDMHGNVWEWVQDCWSEKYPAEPVDGSAYEPDSSCRGDRRRNIKGGSFRSPIEQMRPTYHAGDPAANSLATFGFRIAMDLPRS